MNRRSAYFAPSVGSDYIPNRWQWLDIAIPAALYLVSFGMLAATAFKVFS